MSENNRKFRWVELNWLIEGTGLGALVALWLTLSNLVDALLDDRISGVSAPTIHRFLATEFRAEVVRAAFLVAALSVLIGGALGLAASAVLWLRQLWLGRDWPPPWRRRGQLLVLILGAIGFVYCLDVAKRPALHEDQLFLNGGWRAKAQILITDQLGPVGLWGIALALILVQLLLPLLTEPLWRKKLRFLAVAIAAAATVSLLSYGVTLFRFSTARATPSGRRTPNVLLIAADSLRPDHLDQTRAPNLWALGQHATWFERAMTPLARTFPAWVSISTGQYPQQHGIRHMFPRWETRAHHFDTVASHLAQAGYKTAVVGDFAADIFRRIDLGYQTVNTPTFTLRELVREHLFKNDPWLLSFLRGTFMRRWVPSIVEMHEATDPLEVTTDAVAAVDAAGDRPFFLTVFYSTTHFPYAAPAPYHSAYRAPGYTGPFRYAKADDLRADARPSPSDVEQIRALYDGAVTATDTAIAQLLHALESRGKSDNTIVIVTADHGEQLYEFGRSQGHGDNLEGDEALVVPLIIFDPRRPKARREPSNVSLVDLAPTILELAGAQALAAADGRSLVPSLDGKPQPIRTVYSETGLWFTEVIAEVPLTRRLAYPDLTRISEVDRAHGDQIVLKKRYENFAVAAKHRMIDDGTYRLLYLPTRDGPKFELYERATDPGFTKDVAKTHADVVATLKQQLFAYFDADPLVERRGEALWPR